MSEITDAITRLRSEMGDWGSISMRLSDQQLSDILTLMDAAIQAQGTDEGLRSARVDQILKDYENGEADAALTIEALVELIDATLSNSVKG